MKSERLKIWKGLALRSEDGFTLRSEATKGFTLIELLIVIALIGILAVALLSAINPLEQLRKGRDSTRKADAAEFLNGVERYYASFQCYPWDTTCTGSTIRTPNSGNPALAGIDANLITKNELKSQFRDRLAQASNPSYNRLWVVEYGGFEGSAAGSVAVCFEPESTTGRSGGLGRLVGSVTTTDGPGTTIAACLGNYTGGQTFSSISCFNCMPQ